MESRGRTWWVRHRSSLSVAEIRASSSERAVAGESGGRARLSRSSRGVHDALLLRRRVAQAAAVGILRGNRAREPLQALRRYSAFRKAKPCEVAHGQGAQQRAAAGDRLASCAGIQWTNPASACRVFLERQVLAELTALR